MKVVSSLNAPKASTVDTFASLLELQKERGQKEPTAVKDRPTGELQVSWKLNRKPNGAISRKVNGSGEGQSDRKSNANRRSASKNVFRKMKK